MRVALAVDIGDERVGRVVDAAADWASLSGATVDLLNAEGGRYAFEFVSDPEVRGVLEAEAGRAREKDNARLRALASRLPEANRGSWRVVAGRAVEAISREAASYDALLVGTHGRRGLARFFLGSVAEALVRRCTVPVIVLRAKG